MWAWRAGACEERRWSENSDPELPESSLAGVMRRGEVDVGGAVGGVRGE